jgi:GNAT superfamily N-acetyltransferase
MAIHYAMFIDEALVGCASVTRQEMPDRTARQAHHLHSMAMEPGYQLKGLGRHLLGFLVEEVRETGADLLWATARPSAVPFYCRCGFEAGSAVLVKPINAQMRYVWLTV